VLLTSSPLVATSTYSQVDLHLKEFAQFAQSAGHAKNTRFQVVQIHNN
jgi:hypothetical protein